MSLLPLELQGSTGSKLVSLRAASILLTSLFRVRILWGACRFTKRVYHNHHFHLHFHQQHLLLQQFQPHLHREYLHWCQY